MEGFVTDEILYGGFRDGVFRDGTSEGFQSLINMHECLTVIFLHFGRIIVNTIRRVTALTRSKRLWVIIVVHGEMRDVP